MRRSRRLHASLTIAPDRLVIRHDWMLAKPVTIPREEVAAIVVDGTRMPRRDFRSGRILPLLDPQPRDPNVAVLFTRSVDFPALRCIEVPDRPIRRPRGAETGVLLRVATTDAARVALAGWNPTRVATTQGLRAATARGDSAIC